MADDREDPYAFIVDYCLYSSSQEDLLLRSNFARVNENDCRNLGFRGERKESPILKKGKGLRDEGGIISPLVHCTGKLGFEGESEVVFEGDVKVKVVQPLSCVTPDGVEYSWGKIGFEVSVEGELESCTKKKLEFGDATEVIEVEEDEENVGKNEENMDTEVIEVGEEEGIHVEIEGVDYVDIEMVEADEKGKSCEKVNGDDEEENRKKVDEIYDLDTGMSEFEKEGKIFVKVDDGTSKNEMANIDIEVVGVVEEQGNCARVDGETGNVDMEKIVVDEEERYCKERGVEMDDADKDDENGNGKNKIDNDDGEGEGRENLNDNDEEEEEENRRKKRKLPRSIFEQWGVGLGNGEGCSKDARVEGNGDENEKSKDGEVAIRCILDALKFLVGEKSCGDDGVGGKVDFLETAKRRGMTFPRPRFRPAMEEDA